ncbi:MAG: PAS domain-containing protein [Burkholderiaceae bacterium]|nr:PAS domain-containing protein [Burkholderiaceae bacterium]
MSEHVESQPAASRAVAASGLDAATATALLQHSACAIALCDAQGHISWCNRTLLELSGGAPAEGRGQGLALLLALSGPDAQLLDDALREGRSGQLGDMRVGGPSGSWWRARISLLPDGRRATHWSSVDELHHQSAEAGRLAELLDLAQDFGRLAVWERDARSLQGRWDRHMYRFWGLSEGDGTPDFDRATESILAEDRAGVNQAFRHSLRRAGTYSQRYRVRSADGVLRQVHSQWVVKDGDAGVPERVLGILLDDTEAWDLARSYDTTVQQLSLALELGNIAVWRHDLQSDRVHFSDGTFKLLGRPRSNEPMDAAALIALAHPDDRQALLAGLERTREGSAPVDLETRFRHADGGWRHVLTRSVVQRDANGQPMALLGVGMDMSERVESGKRQTELMRQFELTTRAAGIGYWSVEAGDSRPRWSEQTFLLHGLSPDADALSMQAWLQRFVHPSDRELVQQRYRAWVQRGGPNLVQEMRIVRTDGATRHLLSYSRLEGPSGHYDFYGVLMDVTERRAAETALHQASERAALATRGAGMGTWEQDLVTGQSHWDEQMWRLRGLQPRAQALSVDERMALVHPDDREATLRILNRAEIEGRLSNLEFRVRWPDGQWRWIASRAIAVPDEQGQLTRRIGVNWDITDMRTAQTAREEKLLAQRESRAKSQFLSRMSHELRTPLNAVLGFAQLLLTDGERVTAETRKRRLDQIYGAGQHLLSLINDVLDLSSLEGGEIRISAQPVPLPALVAETLPLVERQARQRKVKLRNSVLQGVALADATRLRQVLLNLLTNAVKYNREGGQVLVEAEAAEDGVLLRVSDTGRGMNEAQLQQAFEPFNRLGLENEGIEGTGIGLAIVKALVERMGGTVQARSAPDHGSVFEVQLPDGSALGRSDASPALQDAAVLPSTRPAGQPGRLLYIEDNPVNLLIVQELLAQRPDLQLYTAIDGLSGVSLALSHRPDLILVDMQLPDIDGHEVLRRLRADEATAAIPCISLSANAMPDDIERALKAGFDDYWTKPLDLRVFMRSLDTIFGVRN